MISRLFTIRQTYCELVKGPARLAQEAAIVTVLGAGVLLALAATVPSLRSFATLALLGCIAILVLITILLLTRAIGRTNELLSSISLYANLISQERLPAPLFLDGAAATPSLQLQLYKCLSLMRPQAILELGSGQTTRVLATYCRDNPDCHVVTLESDPDWHRRLSQDIELSGKKHEYIWSPLKRVAVKVDGAHHPISSLWYNEVPALLGSKFQLILVDGPDSGGQFSRSGILNYLPAILAPSYVIVFDDAERAGERMTIDACERALAAAGLEFVRFGVKGIKDQAVFCSRDLMYLQST